MSKRTVPWRQVLPLAALPVAALLWGSAAHAESATPRATPSATPRATPSATPSATAARAAIITGQVTDSASGTPLANAEVYVVTAPGAPPRGTRTGAGGRYTLPGVDAGEVILRVRLLGYQAAERRLTLRDGETATANFALTTRSVQLDQVVVTGTGGVVQRRAVGNVVETVKATEVLAVAPARSVEQLVGSRTPGVIALPATGQIGTGAQLRVRGVSSLSLSNDPLIYIDGVRMDANTSRGPGQRGGAGASRLNDVNPEDIESIEIIKGPAASTLYGTEASNGVIQIITKRGRSGAARFDFTTRQGTNWMMNPEGRAGMLYAPKAGGGIDSINLYKYEAENGNGPIFTNGRNQGYVLGLNGGTDASRYFMSTSYDNDVGIVPWNWDKKFSARANLDVLAGNKLRLQGNIAHIRDRIRLAQSAINIDPFSQLVWGTPRNLTTGRRGFSDSPPEIWSQVESHADNDRTTLGLTGTYTPWSWFSHRLVTGLDVGAENNWTLYPRLPAGGTDFLGNQALGTKNVARANRTFLTLDYAGSAKWSWRESMEFTSSVGLQHYRSQLSTITATANTFPAGPITTVGGGATTGGDEAFTENATVGLFVQQQAAWNNRVFLTAALRGDDNSTFGKEYSAAYYPKFSASWVVSEEPWFRLPGVGELRLRSAFGAAGTQPGTFDAARLYDPVTGYQNAPGLAPFSFGNPQLRPERSQELEAGFETSVLGGRADVQYTYYTRTIKDAIVNSPLAPSLGFPGSQVLNIGRVKGWGHELAANARVVQTRRFGWELGTQIATNGNRIDDLGGAQFLTVGGGGQAQNRVGFSIADMFLYKVLSVELDPTSTSGYKNAMCDGGTGRSGLEQGGAPVPCATAPRVLWGHTQPTWQVGVNSTFTLFGNLRLYARADGNGGHMQSNTEIRALHNQGSTLGVIKRDDPFLLIYRAIEADAPGTYEAGFLRLREVSATYTMPRWLAQRVAARDGTISLAGRNLMMLWTAQDGWGTSRDGLINVPINNQHVWDPEIRAVGQLSNGFQTILPPTASVVATVRLTF
jgi:TonB-linked SusC/RagA family outer membrane protein